MERLDLKNAFAQSSPVCAACFICGSVYRAIRNTIGYDEE